MRITFVGTAGCGKSTLSSKVYGELKALGHRTEYVHEWIRYDIQANGPMTSIWEQYRTRQHQKELEDAVPSAVDYIITDSGTLTPYFYSVLYANSKEKRQRLVLQDMHKYLLDDIYLNRYDIIFFVPLIAKSDLGDGTRYQTDNEVELIDEHMKLVFTKLHPTENTHVVSSSFENRLDEVMKIILSKC